MPEVSEATATTSMRQLTTLIACLGTNEYSRMGDISAEASAAPSHTVDTLLLCCDELTEGLVSAHREVCFSCKSIAVIMQLDTVILFRFIVLLFDFFVFQEAMFLVRV